LLGVVELGGAAVFFPQDVVNILEGLFKHERAEIYRPNNQENQKENDLGSFLSLQVGHFSKSFLLLFVLPSILQPVGWLLLFCNVYTLFLVIHAQSPL